MASATQKWTHELSVMQQSVLLAAIRGPDGIKKDHVAKLMLRWYRRCILMLAFEGIACWEPWDPTEPRGGSFTGPSIRYAGVINWGSQMDGVVSEYLKHVDEIPHHFQLHFMHAAEILGYTHPDHRVRTWWHNTYLRLVNDMHLFPESREQMMERLGDTEEGWRAREEVTARGPE